MKKWVENLPEEVLIIVSKIAENNGGAWIVGGSVRHGLSGQTPNDYDIATDLEPEILQKIFKHALPTGIVYGTITVRLQPGGNQYEVTTLRSDQEYLDGRRPESVKFGTSLSEDLERRDLTFNAIAVDLTRGEMYDPFDGFEDLKNCVVRAVGDAKSRLTEDGLRILRVYRFMDQDSAGLWLPDESLSSALIECNQMLPNVSVERIWSEFKRILTGKHAADILSRMESDGILNIVFNNDNYTLDGQNKLRGLNGENLLVARLSLLLREDYDPTILNTLSAPNRVTKKVSEIIKYLSILPKPSSKSELRRYRAVLLDNLQLQLAAEEAINGPAAIAVSRALQSLPENKAGNQPLAQGNWIIDQTGISPGVKLGRLKGWLHHIQIENDIETLDELATILNELDWRNSEHSTWPKMTWP